MNARSSLRGSERGAIVIQTAISILMLMGFTVFVCDYGVLLVSRGQAQNAADAGALSGVVSMMLDMTDPSDIVQLDTIAKPRAIATAQANLVWKEAGGVTVSFPLCQEGLNCIQVNVYRTGTNGSTTLPVFFGPILGIDSQGVGAAARAQLRAANATACLGPFAIPDKFVGSEDDTFDPDPPKNDRYTPPGPATMGTGYAVPADFGTILTLRDSPPGHHKVGPGWYRLLDVAQGADTVRESTRACGTNVFGIGDRLTSRFVPGGNPEDVKLAVEDLIALDSTAFWDTAQKRVRSTCVDSGTCLRYDRHGKNLVADPHATVSPRTITLPIVNPRRLAEAPRHHIDIVNFVPFFIIDVTSGALGYEIRGVMLTRAGLFYTDKDQIHTHSAFLKIARLVR